jgi:hypothetical protein
VAVKAKPTTQARQSRKAPASLLPRFDLAHVELSTCELKQRPFNSDEEAKYSYSAVAKNVDYIKKNDQFPFDVGVGWCEFTALKEVKSNNVAEITATYVFLFAIPDPVEDLDFEGVTNFAIALGIWPRFRDLVAHMMAQGSSTFPPLPIKPDRINHARKEDK